MKIKLLLDEDVHAALSVALRNVSKQLPVGQTLSKLLNISGRFSQETIKNHLEFL